LALLIVVSVPQASKLATRENYLVIRCGLVCLTNAQTADDPGEWIGLEDAYLTKGVSWSSFERAAQAYGKAAKEQELLKAWRGQRLLFKCQNGIFSAAKIYEIIYANRNAQRVFNENQRPPAQPKNFSWVSKFQWNA
jgi:hypothetical protein